MTAYMTLTIRMITCADIRTERGKNGEGGGVEIEEEHMGRGSGRDVDNRRKGSRGTRQSRMHICVHRT